jgi:DNA-binding CsgD family transcriptional regulator
VTRDDRTHRIGIEEAVADLVQAGDHDALAQALCSVTAAVTGAGSVVLFEVDGDQLHELARYDRGDTNAGSPVDRAARALRPATESLAGRSAVDEHEHEQQCAVIEFGTDTAPAVLIVDHPLPADEHASILLLADIAVATAERLTSEEHRRAQQTHLRALAEAIRDMGTGATEPVSDRAAEFAAAAALLTDRERDILEDILRGASNARIAEIHTLSIETVKSHVKNILRKLGAANRAELIARSG